MRIDELAYLRALAEDGHVPYAAEALGISQSTLTRAIGRLEAAVAAAHPAVRHIYFEASALRAALH